MDRKANKHFVNPTAVLRKDSPTPESRGKYPSGEKPALTLQRSQPAASHAKFDGKPGVEMTAQGVALF